MNVIKHMEAAFIVALALAAAGSVAVGTAEPAQATTPAVVAGIPVVHVTAKRLTAVEKQQLLALERIRNRA